MTNEFPPYHRGDIVSIIGHPEETHVVFMLYAHGANPPDTAHTLSLVGEGENQYVAVMTGGGIPIDLLVATGRRFTNDELRTLYVRGASLSGLGKENGEELWELLPPELVRKP
ncbi:hypothetical protein HY948_01350 [Candidatus Gottesmanbacteria bacterium]|nr:hypothetical protein [Candidatus Gottesmanbacteria bacterium]